MAALQALLQLVWLQVAPQVALHQAQAAHFQLQTQGKDFRKAHNKSAYCQLEDRSQLEALAGVLPQGSGQTLEEALEEFLLEPLEVPALVAPVPLPRAEVADRI